MIEMQIENLTTDPLVVVTRAGLELSSNDASYADVVVGRERRDTLSARQDKRVGLIAFSLNLEHSFPPPEARYTVSDMREDPDLLALLARINAQSAQEGLEAQLAVWMQATGLSFAEVEKALEMNLDQFEEKTRDLYDPLPEPAPTATAAQAANPTPTTAGTATYTPPTPAPTPGPEDPDRRWIVGVAVPAAVLALGAGTYALVKSQGRRKPAPTPTAHSTLQLPIRPQQEPEETCIGCGRPLSQCRCAGVGSQRSDPQPHSTPGPSGPTPHEQATQVHDTKAKLAAVEGPCKGQVCALADVGDTLISRTELAWMTIPEGAVSAPHALLFLDRPPVRIKDLNSTNGTYVNRRELPVSPDLLPLDKEVELQNGDQIALGNVLFTFQIEPPALIDSSGKRRILPRDQRVILTRRPLPFVLIPEGSISTPHAIIQRRVDHFSVRDLNSGNGTKLSRVGTEGFTYRTITGSEQIEDGQRLQLGHTILEARDLAAASAQGDRIEQIGPYRVSSCIGVGGMAEVYLGHTSDGQQVAVKIPRNEYAYHEGFRERFRREASSTQSLDHPNIVRVTDIGEDQSPQYVVSGLGLQYIAMHYIDGCTLARLLTLGPPLTTSAIVEVLYQVAEALQYAHSRGIVHRDVKPNNIMINRRGQVLLTDFGIARAKNQAPLTLVGQVPGTRWYVAPEQIQNQDISPRTDIYALGVVLYQMLTGQVPFDAEVPQAVYAMHIQDRPTPPDQIRPDVPEDLAAIALKCLEKDPTQRYPSAEALLQELPGREPSATAELCALVQRATRGSQGEIQTQ